MKTRLATLTSRKAFSSSDVIERDIRGTDVISFLDIGVRMTNGAAMTEASVVKIHDDVTKIEVIDGGDVLVSANMEELQALNCFEYGRFPSMDMTLEDDAVQTEWCRVPFGFYPFDPEHYLRPADFGNLAIKVTITMTTAAATAWAAAGHDVTIIAGIMESGFSTYRGFLTTKEVKSYSAVDGTREDIDLNTDWDYRAILIQAFKTATRPDENIEIVKLTADDDKAVMLELYTTELQAQNLIDFGRFTQKYAKRLKADSDTLLADVYLGTTVSPSGGTATYATVPVSVDAESCVIGTYAQT